jgi:hypothetical protein
MSKRTLTVSGVAIAAGLIGAAMAPATAQAAVPAKAGASVSSGTVYYAAKLAGKNEVPVQGGPKVGDKNGSAYVVLKITGNHISYAGRWSGIATPPRSTSTRASRAPTAT